MGVRKRNSAQARKDALKDIAFAKLTNVLGILKFSNKEAAARVEKLLRSAIANWEAKNDRKAESGELYISTIFVDPAPMLKRLRTAPQGRGYRIRKRANHVTLVVDTIDKDVTIKDKD